MSKRIVAAAAALLFIAVHARADQQVWTVSDWPGDLDVIPCSAWTKHPDGTWVLSGAIKLGSEVMNNIGVKGDIAARQLDRTCGKK